MLRLKRQYRQLGTRLVVGGCLATLLYCCTLHLPAQSRVRQAVLTTENYTWTRLSDDVYLLSAYFDVREDGRTLENCFSTCHIQSQCLRPYRFVLVFTFDVRTGRCQAPPWSE